MSNTVQFIKSPTAAKAGKALLILGAIFGGILLIDHHLSVEYPDTHSGPLSYAQSHPWSTVTTIPGPTAADLAAATVTGGGIAQITGCQINYGVSAPKSSTSTKVNPTKTVATVSGTVTNTSTSVKDYLIEVAITAGSFNFGAASAQANLVQPGQVVSWSATGTVSNHPTAVPTCTIQAVEGETG